MPKAIPKDKITKLRLALYNRGITGSDLARAAGWSVKGRLAQRVLRGDVTIGTDKASVISKWLGLPLSLLFDETRGPSGKKLYRAKFHVSDWGPPW
jgi:transcriptional regulator with XRE-family HTH domain